MYFQMTLPVASLKQFCNIEEFQDPSSAHLLFVVFAASGNEQHRSKLHNQVSLSLVG